MYPPCCGSLHSISLRISSQLRVYMLGTMLENAWKMILLSPKWTHTLLQILNVCMETDKPLVNSNEQTTLTLLISLRMRICNCKWFFIHHEMTGHCLLDLPSCWCCNFHQYIPICQISLAHFSTYFARTLKATIIHLLYGLFFYLVVKNKSPPKKGFTTQFKNTYQARRVQKVFNRGPFLSIILF